MHDDAINAFALPGGPMYIHTGLIKSAENEGQMAGVLAHEMAHVILRHGTNNASKAQLANLGMMVAGAAVGGGGTLMGLVTQVGGSIVSGNRHSCATPPAVIHSWDRVFSRQPGEAVTDLGVRLLRSPVAGPNREFRM